MKSPVSATAAALCLAACSAGDTQPVDPTATDTASAADAGATVDEAPPATVDATPRVQQRGSTEDADTASGATELDGIPSAYRGTWARNSSDCAARNFNRVTIAADRVSFFEDGGIASDVSQNGNALAVTYPFENPNGVTERRIAYFAQESADRIRVKQGHDGPSETYLRCRFT